MSKPAFVYTTYIETTPEKLWHALTDGDFTERFWFGHRLTSDWKIGSSYRFTHPQKASPSGKVLISQPPNKLSYTWDGCSEEVRHEGSSRVTFDIEPLGKVVKLTVVHDNLVEGGETFRGISVGWPMVIASLKSLLETGQPLPTELADTVKPQLARA